MRILAFVIGLVLSISTLSSQSVQSSVNEVQLTFNKINKSENLEFRNSEVVDGFIFRYLKVDNFLTKEEHQLLNSKGIELLDYVGFKTYLTSIPSDLKSNELIKSGFSYISNIDRDSKASYEVDAAALPNYAIEGTEAKLMLNYMNNLEESKVRILLEEAGVKIEHSNGKDPFLQVRCDIDYIPTLIDLPYIAYVEAAAPPSIKDDRRGRNLQRVNRVNGVNGAARNYTGDGVNVLVRDDGKVYEHIDFKGRKVELSAEPSRISHSNGVAGIFCGAGNLDPYFQGMAINATMYVTDYQANFLDETLDLHTDDNILVTNSSYSNGCNGGYTSSARTVDGQMREYPKLMHVFSAGNSGQGILNSQDQLVECGYGAGLVWGNVTGGHKIGKNVIATANLNYLGELEASSSRGPAADGRIKPDLAANGFGHQSTGANQGYRVFGGTSAAAPVVAGVATLLQEAYTKNHGDIADAALLKAIMLNTANDMGNVGPDFKFGWGAVNAHRAALVIEENRFIQGVINQGESLTYDIPVPAGKKQLRVMTYWVDRENVTSASNNLVNDLNTTLVGNGIVHQPWILDHTPDPVKLNLPATKGEDHKNNMEQIAITNPSESSYELRIGGDELPFGDGAYYVVWEYDSEEVDIVYPNGKENIEQGENMVIHWDAFGTEDPFLVEVFNDNDSLIISRNVLGDRRLVEVGVPELYTNSATVRITRNGLVEESDASFVISSYTDNVEIDNSTGQSMLVWPAVENAQQYYLYRLGDKFMEISDTVTTNSFMIPDDPFYTDSWLAVSAVFEGNKEGKRSRAIPGKFTGAKIAPNEQPACKNQPYTFATENPDPNTTYLWEFGAGATPATANTVGPHEVTYVATGAKVVLLSIQNLAGANGTFQAVMVGDVPTNATISETDLGGGTYEFSTGTQSADSLIWEMGDGTILMGTSVNHTYEATGTYDIVLRATNGCGDIETSTSVTVVMVAIEDLTERDFSLIPNPSNGHIQLALPDLEGNSLQLQLFGMDGRLLKSEFIKSPGMTYTLDYSNITNGIYQLELTFDKKSLVTKVVIQ